MLNDDAIPTLFTHNDDKQPATRKFSILREHERAKRQHCEDAFLHSEQVERFEFEYSTKETQTERVVLGSSSTQTPPLPTKAHIAVQCCIEINICNELKENYIKILKSILEEVKEKGPCYLSGDGRCDGPGHNAKYLTYSFMDKNMNKIVACSLTEWKKWDLKSHWDC